MSAKDSTGSPLTASTTSPAGAAARFGSGSIEPIVGRSVGDALPHDEAGEDDDRQKEVEERPGEHGQHPPADGGAVEGVARSSGAHLLERLGVGAARGVAVAEELDVAAERQRRDLPERAAPVAARPDHRAEADGEHLRADAAPARDDVVAVFVDEDHDAEHDDEGQDGGEEPAEEGDLPRSGPCGLPCL
jgi:hypothetical protein